MATVTFPNRHFYNKKSVHTLLQKICIGIGLVFVVLGLVGIMLPGMMGFHLSFAHNIIHLVSGALGIWAGQADSPKRAYNFVIAFGSLYGLLGVMGLLIGRPGYPGVGHMAVDGNLLRIIPNVLELGTNDHVLHLILSVTLITAALLWGKKKSYATRSIVDVQRRKDFSDTDTLGGQPTRTSSTNSNSDLRDADLGQSDVNRLTDMQRRRDFERRA